MPEKQDLSDSTEIITITYEHPKDIHAAAAPFFSTSITSVLSMDYATIKAFRDLTHLISMGSDLNIKNNEGNTVLHRLVRMSKVTNAALIHIKAINILLEHGADIRALNNNDKTPLDLAIEGNYFEAFKIFIAKLFPKKKIKNSETIDLDQLKDIETICLKCKNSNQQPMLDYLVQEDFITKEYLVENGIVITQQDVVEEKIVAITTIENSPTAAQQSISPVIDSVNSAKVENEIVIAQQDVVKEKMAASTTIENFPAAAQQVTSTAIDLVTSEKTVKKAETDDNQMQDKFVKKQKLLQEIKRRANEFQMKSHSYSWVTFGMSKKAAAIHKALNSFNLEKGVVGSTIKQINGKPQKVFVPNANLLTDLNEILDFRPIGLTSNDKHGKPLMTLREALNINRLTNKVVTRTLSEVQKYMLTLEQPAKLEDRPVKQLVSST